MREQDIIQESLTEGGRVIANMMASKMRFILIIVSLGMIGILFAHGFSWSSLMFTLLAVVIVGSAYIAFSFWIWFFRNLGGSSRQKGQL